MGYITPYETAKGRRNRSFFRQQHAGLESGPIESFDETKQRISIGDTDVEVSIRGQDHAIHSARNEVRGCLVIRELNP